jgi:hypothetical protein
MISAFLIAQFGKNHQYSNPVDFGGAELMDMTMSILKETQRKIGGGMVYLECEDKPKLLEFYQKDTNGFKVFDERISRTDGIRYIQMVRFH